MRAFIAILVLGGAALGGWYAFSELAADNGKIISIAFGMPVEGRIEMHTIISNRMANLDPPKKNLRGKILWQEWVDDHFAMFDDSGGAVPLRYRSSTDIIPDLDLRGFQRGFVVAHLEQASDYAMEHRPTHAGTDRYRHSFTAPSDKVSLTRPLFKPVE